MLSGAISSSSRPCSRKLGTVSCMRRSRREIRLNERILCRSHAMSSGPSLAPMPKMFLKEHLWKNRRPKLASPRELARKMMDVKRVDCKTAKDPIQGLQLRDNKKQSDRSENSKRNRRKNYQTLPSQRRISFVAGCAVRRTRNACESRNEPTSVYFHSARQLLYTSFFLRFKNAK